MPPRAKRPGKRQRKAVENGAEPRTESQRLWQEKYFRRMGLGLPNQTGTGSDQNPIASERGRDQSRRGDSGRHDEDSPANQPRSPHERDVKRGRSITPQPRPERGSRRSWSRSPRRERDFRRSPSPRRSYRSKPHQYERDSRRSRSRSPRRQRRSISPQYERDPRNRSPRRSYRDTSSRYERTSRRSWSRSPRRQRRSISPRYERNLRRSPSPRRSYRGASPRYERVSSRSRFMSRRRSKSPRAGHALVGGDSYRPQANSYSYDRNRHAPTSDRRYRSPRREIGSQTNRFRGQSPTEQRHSRRSELIPPLAKPVDERRSVLGQDLPPKDKGEWSGLPDQVQQPQPQQPLQKPVVSEARAIQQTGVSSNKSTNVPHDTVVAASNQDVIGDLQSDDITMQTQLNNHSGSSSSGSRSRGSSPGLTKSSSRKPLPKNPAAAKPRQKTTATAKPQRKPTTAAKPQSTPSAATKPSSKKPQSKKLVATKPEPKKTAPKKSQPKKAAASTPARHRYWLRSQASLPVPPDSETDPDTRQTRGSSDTETSSSSSTDSPSEPSHYSFVGSSGGSSSDTNSGPHDETGQMPTGQCDGDDSPDSFEERQRARIQSANEGETPEGHPSQIGYIRVGYLIQACPVSFESSKTTRRLDTADVLSLPCFRGCEGDAWFTDNVIYALADIEGTYVHDVYVELELNPWFSGTHLEDLPKYIKDAEDGKPISADCLGFPFSDWQPQHNRCVAVINPSGLHWMAVEILFDTDGPVVRCFNSMQGDSDASLPRQIARDIPMLLYFASFQPGWPMGPFLINDIKTEHVDCPRQARYSGDCGPLTLFFLAQRLHDLPVFPAQLKLETEKMRSAFGQWVRERCIEALWSHYCHASFNTSFSRLVDIDAFSAIEWPGSLPMSSN
jgi:hypothetical protein